MAYELFVRWLIALLTGGGLAIIAITNLAMQKEVSIEFKVLFFKSLWFFTASLGTAFFSGLSLITAYFSQSRQTDLLNNTESTDTEKSEAAKKTQKWLSVANVCFYFSAIAFAIAVGIPLISVTIYDYF